jgi:phosphatidyl-myo-inositol dimannoside synthase
MPALGAVTLELGGDGVAYAGALLKSGLASITGKSPCVLELSPASTRGPSRAEEARFVLRLNAAQFRHADSWWLFNHIGIARATRLVPRHFRRQYAVLLCGIEVWDPNLSAGRKATLREASARIAISEVTSRRVREAHPDVGAVSSCPLALLPSVPGIGLVDDALLALVNATSVLIVGRMSRSERYKGHDELLECWRDVVASVPDAQLVVCGKGDDLERLRIKAGELELAKNVLFAGFVSDETLEALRARVAFFAMPSRGEGFGLVYLEAMRAGLPCIGGIEDAGAEVIVPGETGLCVDPADRRALAHAIVLLLTSRTLRGSYGDAGCRRFESTFTFERFCERLRPILQAAFA